MEFFANNNNGNVYQLISAQRDPFSGQIMQANIKRLYDGYDVSLGANFNTTYRPLTTEEVTKLEVIRPNFEPRRAKVNVSNIINASTNPEENTEGEVGVLVEPGENCTLDRLIVVPEVKTKIEMGLDLILKRKQLDEDWGLNEIEPMTNKAIMNLVGPPGTGKTMSAKVIAKMVGKKLYQVDYASVISKYVGDTAKNIKIAFEAAKKHNAILFFDEADSLMSKRISMPDDGVANSINQNRNVLMQELDKYDGIMLTATNFFVNYDEALLRRISTHIQFDLPTKDLRAKLLEQHIPTKTKTKMDTVDYNKLAEISNGLSGGDILVSCSNAVKRAFSESVRNNTVGRLQEAHIISEIESVKRTKEMHKGNKASV